ncbi:hypothetical protein MPTK1_3g01590 [Marchantia polymorpha subsp. ruderalis]|uniref:Glutaredoxin-like protein n=2 Tax=Marchantia polymorpha TaxID=3197 RepID=A0AAF6AWD1_MARPO|nr:hypothetical protein MARPO_0007s0151 [Marchantia polymorpha]BBN04065.1 hypothetical protein Mp_3g01590 [Marchantia polymorpha subsp. ruderalis]|eukprot:PTQ47752.1 hypothetical protein MARPO_0007s0151 [Marchantia polymorpha]
MMSGSMMSVKRGLQSVACSPLAEIAVLPRLGNWVRGRPTVCFTGASAKVVRRGAVSISPTGTRCASSSTSSSSSDEEVPRAEATDDLARRLIMYSKPGCCLCDGLKEKLTTLPNIQLEVRNILTKPEWENAYQYEIPVLAHVKDDGSEETIPRLSPRLSADQMRKKLEAVLG